MYYALTMCVLAGGHKRAADKLMYEFSGRDLAPLYYTLTYPQKNINEYARSTL